MPKETLIYAHDSQSHSPPYEIYNGKHDHYAECPSREIAIKTVLQRTGYKIQESGLVVPENVLTRVHSPEYIEFLRSTSTLIPKTEYHYPSVFRLLSYPKKPTNILALQGYHSIDTYTPLSESTYAAALSSASLAWAVAYAITTTDTKFGYALCRPGHHAEVSQMGGYCYLNNAAITAEYLSAFGKVAILDVDYHHGNGTQHIFYHRRDVLTISIHGDPHLRYPNLSGYESEIGVDNGENYNRNYVLSDNASNKIYQATLDQALDRVAEFVPDYLVVAFGADTHGEDSYEGFKLTTDYYEKMASTIAQVNLPTVVLQEGGYNVELLGHNVVSFLRGFE